MSRTSIARFLPPSSRIIVLPVLALILLYLIATTARGRLQYGSFDSAFKGHASFNPFGNGVGNLLLRSRRNPTGSANWVDHKELHERVFNPTLLELPKGSAHDFLVIARQGQEVVKIKDKKYKKGHQVAFFADVVKDEHGVPSIARQSTWSRTFLDDIMPPEHHCSSESHIMGYIGPEDGKLFWMRDGAPILMFTNQVPYKGECQGMFFVDLRAVIPELESVLGKYANEIGPIKYDKPLQLRREMPAELVQDGSYHFEREKNWIPFQTFLGDPKDDPLMFSAHLVEPRIYQFMPGEKYVKHAGTPEKPQTCLEEKMAHGIHQGTPILSVTLCRRGECEPSIHNTVLMGLVQKRMQEGGLHYDKRIVTWNATSPYEYRSLSKQIEIAGTANWGYTWTGSMVYYWDHIGVPKDRSHGFLDDEVWLSFGVADKAGGWVDVLASELVEDHISC